MITFKRTDGLSFGVEFGITPLEAMAADDEAPRGRSATAAWDLSLPHHSIAALLPHDDRGVDFSESLGGAVTDTDLDVWLAILGGGRILASHKADFSKIGPLPLCDFTTEAAGSSPIYVLAALPEDRPLEFSMSDDIVPDWQSVEPVATMPGVRHLRVPGPSGPKLVSFRLPGCGTWTYASLTSPNRVTLLTLTLDEDGDARVSQYLLPIGHLVSHLPGDLPAYVDGRVSPLDDVRNLATAGRAFRKRGDMGRHIPGHLFQELAGAKWVDPIGSAFVAYQALRRGDKALVRHVATNMLQFFPELPDSTALAIRSGMSLPRPPGIPLILDGLRAYPDYATWLALPAGLLDGRGPWTAWRGAV